MQKQIKLIAAASAALVITGNAAVVSKSTTAPIEDGLDIANFAAVQDKHKWFDDGGHNMGQTFTPSADAILTSFTLQLGDNGANADDGPDTVNFRLGTITRPLGVFTFTDIITPEASPQAPSGDWDAEDWVTYTMDTPTALTAGVEYGVILDYIVAGDWQGGGIAYSYRSNNVATTGVNSGIFGGSLEAPSESTNRDMIFHANLDAVPEPSTTALLGLGGLALILRRRK